MCAVEPGRQWEVNGWAIQREDVGASVDGATPQTRTSPVSGAETVVPDPRVVSSTHYLLKRAMDVVGAALLLVLFLPLVPLIVVAILLDSGRPIIYSQQRVRGRRVNVGGEWVWRLEPFVFYKFRTMNEGAAATTHEQYMAAYIAGDRETLARLRPTDTSEGTYKLLEDPRVTRVGRVLRGLSLDELPQLWNVLIGDMSLVGPRPPIPYEVAMYRPEDMARFASVPGITGMWQVSGRSDLSFDEMIALDCDYIRRQSVGLDLVILLRTVPAVFSRKGAG